MNFAFADVAASSTDEPLVNPITGAETEAVAGQKIRVFLAYIVGDDTATDVTFYSVGDTSTAISPVLAFGSSSGISLPYAPTGIFETLPGEGLGVTTGTGATQGVHVVYAYLPSNAH